MALLEFTLVADWSTQPVYVPVVLRSVGPVIVPNVIACVVGFTVYVTVHLTALAVELLSLPTIVAVPTPPTSVGLLMEYASDHSPVVVVKTPRSYNVSGVAPEVDPFTVVGHHKKA
ncbi:hypothetical protein CCAX7_30910 [Capsulimonas corticalis]|uniref:Uncharacterized protein n=1 Tax=Capsulimonas corticalis TaxID=2219043 RepID=A0A402CSM0_9BACT|nr:hypothetical protein CCAX7_30910 [Capsulimonas corticalis]